MSHIISPSHISRLFSWLVNAKEAPGDKPGPSSLSAEGQTQRTSIANAPLVLSPLEKLPQGPQILILASAPDFATLRDLVHASPVYHRTYSSVKAEILSALIQKQQVPGTKIDALAALLSLDYADGMQDHPDAVIAFLDRYRHARGAGRWANTKNPQLPVRWRPLQTDIDDLITVIKFHNLTEHLTDRFLEFMEATNGRFGFTKADGLITISIEERMRIHRAIYRLQTYHHLFGMAESTSRMQTDSLFVGPEGENISEREIWDLFFLTFTSWERKEMYTMHYFVTICTIELISTLRADPKKDVRYIVPHDNFYYLTFESIACAGPLFLAKAMRPQTFDQQYSVVADNFECILCSLSRSIGRGPIASSIRNVCIAESLRPHNLLYPADEIVSVTSITRDGYFDMSSMPWHDKPSAGFKYYSSYFRFWTNQNVPEPAHEEVKHNMVFQMRKVIEGGPWSFVFWDRERLVQAGVVNATTTWIGIRVPIFR